MDEIQENAAHLNDLLAEAKARDAEIHDLAEKAKFAGDANPYKEPKQHSDDED
jgi:ribosome-binding factor A